MRRFNTVFYCLLALTATSAVLAFLIGIADAFLHIPHGERLIGVFSDGFKMGAAGLFGLLTGCSVDERRR